jgi:hypothetical protein
MNTKVDYCIIVLKYYSPKYQGDNLINSNRAFRWAIDQNVDMINYSGGGVDLGGRRIIQKAEALDRNIVIVAAAGNEGMNLKEQGYYPAMYNKNIIVVGNLTTDNDDNVIRAPSSNYGKEVDIQVFGTDIESVNGIKMTGTSQSTAIVAGRLAKHVKSYRLTEYMRKMDGKGTDSYYSPLYKYTR